MHGGPRKMNVLVCTCIRESLCFVDVFGCLCVVSVQKGRVCTYERVLVWLRASDPNGSACV